MTEDNENRLVVAFERIAEALTRLANIDTQRYNRRYPPKTGRATEIIREGDEKREQFDYAASPDWHKETEAREPSRFQKRFDESSKERDAAKGSGTKAPRDKSRIIRPNSKD